MPWKVYAKYIMTSNPLHQRIAPNWNHWIHPELVSNSTCLWDPGSQDYISQGTHFWLNYEVRLPTSALAHSVTWQSSQNSGKHFNYIYQFIIKDAIRVQMKSPMKRFIKWGLKRSWEQEFPSLWCSSAPPSQDTHAYVHQSGSSTNSFTFRFHWVGNYDTTIMAESKKELKSLLMKVKEESEKTGMKTQHSKN